MRISLSGILILSVLERRLSRSGSTAPRSSRIRCRSRSQMQSQSTRTRLLSLRRAHQQATRTQSSLESRRCYFLEWKRRATSISRTSLSKMAR